MDRRKFFHCALYATAAAACPAIAKGPAKRVLLRSSWQTVNIGDIAHTPGMLTLLEKHLPATEVTLWPNTLSEPVAVMLRARFPRLRIATSSDQQKAAMAECDFCLHGSGPGLVGAKQMRFWRKTGKPFGFGGVTLNDSEIRNYRNLLEDAESVFCRDTLSLEALRATGLTGPAMEFGPDATFACDLRNDVRADAFLRDHSLEPGRFACFVPRLRYTPYWKEGRTYPPGEVARRTAANDKHAETDHAKLRAAIVAWVRKTRKKALLCPEMTYQVELLRPLLFDRLPADVKPYVVVRPDYWLTDEAASTYARAVAVVSFELHSPIIAVANGTPAIHLRQPTDTRKGQMWRDVGLGEWLFEIEPTTGEQIASRLLEIHGDPRLAKRRVARAQKFTAERGRAMMQAVSRNLGLTGDTT